MTLVPVLPHRARLVIRTSPSVLAVVALLLSGLSGAASAQQTITALPIAFPISTVDSVVTKVNGPILDVFDGALQIDVSNARITGGDDRLANPLPWSGILVGSRIVAVVEPPPMPSTAMPPRLIATSVVVFLADAGSLSGLVQHVDTGAGTFLLLDVTVMTNASTQWSGTKSDGTPVKGIGDLTEGMFASANVIADGSGVTAKSVFAYGFPTWRIIAFRGRVEKIDGTIWTIGGSLVQVTSETKLVGDPQVGDLVDVVEKVQILPPGSMAPTMIPVAISITKVTIIPPPGRTVEFDGVVESLPPGPTAGSNALLGHWMISGRDVIVTGMTKVDAGITVGTAVHVKGIPLPMSILASSNATPSILATEITKR